MNDHTALIMTVIALTTLVALLVALAAGYLARRDRATPARAVMLAATTFAATLTLAAVLATALQTLIH